MAEDQSAEALPMDADELEALVLEMRKMQLATDQRAVAERFLSGRSLTCSQAANILEVVQLGIMKRMLARDVLRGRLSDVPEGLNMITDGLSGQLQSDIARELGGINTSGFTDGRSSSVSLMGENSSSVETLKRSMTMPMRSSSNAAQTTLGPGLRRRADWAESVERLRLRACSGDGSDLLYEDIRSVFEALGLGTLPPRSDAVHVGAGAACASSLASLPQPPRTSQISQISNGTASQISPLPRPTDPRRSAENPLPGEVRPQSQGSDASEESV